MAHHRETRRASAPWPPDPAGARSRDADDDRAHEQPPAAVSGLVPAKPWQASRASFEREIAAKLRSVPRSPTEEAPPAPAPPRICLTEPARREHWSRRIRKS